MLKLSQDGVQEVLDVIFENSVIKSIEGLEDQFSKIATKTGTLVLISSLTKDLKQEDDQAENPDIRFESSPDNPFMRSHREFALGSDIPIDYSLRAQSELLLRRCEGGEDRMLKFHI